MEKAHTIINNSLSKKKPGELLFLSDFKGAGSDAAIRQSLSRLVRAGRIKRIAHGIYYLPKTDPLLGELHPSAEEIAQKIAAKERVRIQPSGAYALNKLGLSTQVPTRLVYLTDGPQRLITVGKMKIRFKATTAKKLSLKGDLSKLIILALDELDLKNMDERREARIKDLLLKEDPKKLKHDLSLAPGRTHDYIVKLLKQK
ncbi:Transcriptional regulator, AbiEi antitoxin, Type IV TA system [Lacibacter cauensis]|uniref:Transcriptional regulator, AbiEi antitoxin, Type IV TA system n=1 Tax=Lacibacter cauensis TaxID=510947 RepID=A0A562SCW9_9BACT|nr:DUF6088 family protein [Lacibacter cauensis]TWI79033.1 Transcriptional regulator, AbiEi antitoxin, Type IV TA system [Lacibacter cauensis]